jgi:hypothetical protein
MITVCFMKGIHMDPALILKNRTRMQALKIIFALIEDELKKPDTAGNGEDLKDANRHLKKAVEHIEHALAYIEEARGTQHSWDNREIDPFEDKIEYLDNRRREANE